MRSLKHVWIRKWFESFIESSLYEASEYDQEIPQSYEGWSKITEPYLITFELSKMVIYLDDISLKLYVIYLISEFISVGRFFCNGC